MIDEKAIAEYRKFYHENGYLPHKAADAIILIAESLWKENAELKEAYDEISAIAKKWIAKSQKLEAVATAAETFHKSIDSPEYDFKRRELIVALIALKNQSNG